jgi:HPt (histidine-containing phosphotransfer) domain-containing protein
MGYKFINIDYLNTVSGGDPDIIKEIVVMFKEQSIEIYNEMKSHLQGKKYILLGSLAHKAKSSVLIMGMNDLAIMLKTLEVQAKEGRDSELYESYIERFKTETDAAVIELEDLVRNNLKGM